MGKKYVRNFNESVGVNSVFGGGNTETFPFEKELLVLTSHFALLSSLLDEVVSYFDEGKRGKALQKLGQIQTTYTTVFRKLLAENPEYAALAKKHFEQIKEVMEDAEKENKSF